MNQIEHTVEIARGMLSIPGEHGAGSFIQKHRREFIWDDDDDYVGRWNDLVGVGAGLEDVAQSFEEDGQPFLTYKGKTVKVPILFERGDGTICVFTLARLVAADSEIRMCSDTCGNSEYVYLPLPPAEWLKLEAAFGQAAIDLRFLRLPDTLDEFYRAIEEQT